MVTPPPIVRTHSATPLSKYCYFLGLWGLAVLWIGVLGSGVAGVSIIRTMHRILSLQNQYGARWSDIPPGLGGASSFGVYMDCWLLIGFLIVSCLGGILYRYAHAS